MLEAYQNLLPFRLGFAAVFFLTLGVRDWIKHPENPTRVNEYLFLIVAMFLSVGYAVIHDHITCTISADYFLHAKGLANQRQPFRIAVTLLAIKATYGPGLLSGALLLIANNPSEKYAQLSYRHLLGICVYPVWGALCFAFFGGVLAASLGGRTWLADTAAAYAPAAHRTAFLAVAGIHVGSYLGATCGTVWAIVTVIRRRKSGTQEATS